MKVTIVGRQMNVYDEMKELIDKKLGKFDKFFSTESSATATLSVKHNLKYMEITISAGGTLFRSEVGAETFRDALDECVENILRQIRKNKTKLSKRLHDRAFDSSFAEHDAEDAVDENEVIIRTKTFPLKPMSPEEAILQMNLLGHRFFVFNNDGNGKTCVVYLRQDGGYGLIVPESI